MSDTLGVLYEQEDSEIEFLDSFIDYDDISIIYKTVDDREKTDVVTASPIGGDHNEIVVVTDKDEEVTREIIINGSETSNKTSRTNMRERLIWLKSKGRLIFRSLSCKCLGRRFSREKLRYSVTAERSKEESESDIYDTEQHQDLVKVRSFHIQQEKVKIKQTENATSDPETKPGYNKAVTELENLEKLILKDSLRESFLKQRGMETIREEPDLAFSNLSYGMVRVDGSKLNNYYENFGKTRQNLYENVSFPTQTTDQNQYYENVPQPMAALQMSNDDEYESYDFGEEGIYQNVMFTNGSSSINSVNSDVKIDALQKRINEVNDIIKIKSNDNQAEKVYQSNLIVTLSKPTSSIKEEKTDSKAWANNRPPQKPLRSISNNFKTWALSKAEHPKVDLNKLPKQKNATTGIFSEEEKNVVSDFLKTCKDELKIK